MNTDLQKDKIAQKFGDLQRYINENGLIKSIYDYTSDFLYGSGVVMKVSLDGGDCRLRLKEI